MKYKILYLALIYATTLHAQGSAVTQLAMINPNSGGSILEPGSYYLGYDVTGNITIASSNVLLDLNTHTITGNILVSGPLENISITNGSVKTISLANCTNVIVSDLKVDTSFEGSQINVLSISHILTPNFMLKECANATVLDTRCNNGTNFLIFQSTKIEVINCSAYGNTLTGFKVEESENVLFQNCVSNANQGNGYSIEDTTLISQNITFKNCVANSNNLSGFYISSGSNTLVENCISYNNTRDGFTTLNNLQMIIQGCVAFKNNATGFSAPAGTTNSQFLNNYAYNNTTNYSAVITGIFPATLARFWENTFD